MGVSTNAVLFYGYCWEEEGASLLPEGTDGDWAKLVAIKRGHKNPWDGFPKYLDDSSHPEYVRDYQTRKNATDQWAAGHRDELDAWYATRQDIEKEFGVELGRHCSDECPMPYLCIAGKDITAYRGHRVEVNPAEAFATGEDWDAKLDGWLAEMGVEKPHPVPKWWLVSYWG